MLTLTILSLLRYFGKRGVTETVGEEEGT